MRRPAILLPVALICAFFACGGRTPLLVPEEAPARDAGIDVVMRDAPPALDVIHDVAREPDVTDAIVFPDVPLESDCPDAGATLVYVLTSTNDLYSFYPATLAFTRIGTIACPTTGFASPFSMAVDRAGIAYSVFTDGELFRLDTKSAACEATGYAPDQLGFSTFGMGYVANTGDAGETLFVAEGNVTVTPKPNSLGLGSINTTALNLSFVGPFVKSIPGPELTGTADGTLYAFFTNATGTGSNIVQVDQSDAHIVSGFGLQVGEPSDAYAFAFWGGKFWVFTSDGFSGTQVTEFDPQTLTETPATTFTEVIVGAGVSTCAPM